MVMYIIKFERLSLCLKLKDNGECCDLLNSTLHTAQKMKFSIKDFFSKCSQIRRKLKKSLKESFIFCTVTIRVFINILNFDYAEPVRKKHRL